ncbi:hypothetical protein F442_02312 [Phytophthora nicotianae P10297]|uniref:Peptidase S1 domain-containing protein n=1 Tax=Phytophthora nicotianae P10297 TaxID=1317064 RepID=W3A0H0_PHYNI|nr:hypothetical protein F442_02312 [Phytophthora nicotianae P10297]
MELKKLERPSSFQPVKLAAADDSDFKPGTVATTMGWGTNAEINGTAVYELQRVDVPLVSDEACAAFATVDSSMVVLEALRLVTRVGVTLVSSQLQVRTCWSV